MDSSYAAYPWEFYDTELAVAPGWKAGGWAPWGRTDPCPQDCGACGAQMVPLLTIASFEWDGGPGSWVPYADRAAAATSHIAGQNPAQPTGVENRQHRQPPDLRLPHVPGAPAHRPGPVSRSTAGGS
ncbi:hypothetical protein [Streptomyces cirratus]|uniref:hypothetical protein n=1 Tax=Streptomyces cirratus TaxID=68187 RepID=UPI00361F61D1